MAKVTGVGGFFFRARDPKALAAWYEEHLGITPAPTDMETATLDVQRRGDGLCPVFGGHGLISGRTRRS